MAVIVLEMEAIVNSVSAVIACGSSTDVTPNPRDYASDALLAKAEWRDRPGGPLTLAGEASLIDQQTSIDAFLGLQGTRFVNSTLLEGDDRAERYRLSASQKLGVSRVRWKSA